MTAPTLRTDRLKLRPHRASDVEPWTAFCTSQAARYIGGPMEPHRAWTFLTEAIAQWELYGHGGLAIELADGSFAGQILLFKPPTYPELELGWNLFPEFQRQGYATEAAMAVRDFAYETLKPNSLVSYITPANARSVQLAKRLGAWLDPEAALPEWAPCTVYRHPSREALA